MDMAAISTPTVSTQQVNVQSQQAASKANGAAPFQDQLNQLVNQTKGDDSAVTTPVSTENQVVVEEVASENVTLTAEQLTALIEGLIEKIDELIDAPVSEEDTHALEEMSMQLLAILQLFTVDNQSIKDLINQYTTLTTSSNTQVSEIKVSNELLYKLQDQLLVLQQVIKEGNFKAVQGQQPEQIMSQIVSKFDKLIDSTKENSKAQLIQQLTNQAESEHSIQVDSLKVSTFDQLKHLAKQGEYGQLSNQASQTPVTAVVNQQIDTVTAANLQGTVPFSAQLSETVSMLKGQSQSSAFTTVNQFADTVKTMVLQKFDLAQLTNSISQARITLNPESLGSVDIKLSMNNGVLTAIFSAETLMAKDALENQMSVLRGTLAAQGITVERMEVTEASFNEELEWQQQRQNQSDAESEKNEEHDESFEEQLEANVVSQELGFGRAVNETI